MRKILAAVLALTMTLLFAACGDNKDEGTTLDPLYTAYSPVVTNGHNQGNNSAVGATYVLTTNQSKTVPALNTTRFTPGAAATVVNPVNPSASTNYNDVSYTTGSSVTAPVVSTTRAISTTWATIPTTTTTTTATTTTLSRVTTTRPTTQPTTKAEPMGVDVVIANTSSNTDGRVMASIESAGWGGALKANSQRVEIYVDGVPMEKPVMLQISSSTDGDGNQYVFLDLDEYGIDFSSSTVTFTIPEGFLENKTGTKYNYAYEVTL